MSGSNLADWRPLLLLVLFTEAVTDGEEIPAPALVQLPDVRLLGTMAKGNPHVGCNWLESLLLGIRNIDMRWNSRFCPLLLEWDFNLTRRIKVALVGFTTHQNGPLHSYSWRKLILMQTYVSRCLTQDTKSTKHSWNKATEENEVTWDNSMHMQRWKLKF